MTDFADVHVAYDTHPSSARDGRCPAVCLHGR